MPTTSPWRPSQPSGWCRPTPCSLRSWACTSRWGGAGRGGAGRGGWGGCHWQHAAGPDVQPDGCQLCGSLATCPCPQPPAPAECGQQDLQQVGALCGPGLWSVAGAAGSAYACARHCRCHCHCRCHRTMHGDRSASSQRASLASLPPPPATPPPPCHCLQLILFLVFCLAFWFGGREVSKANISFEDMMKVGVAFSPLGVAFPLAVAFQGQHLLRGHDEGGCCIPPPPPGCCIPLLAVALCGATSHSCSGGSPRDCTIVLHACRPSTPSSSWQWV